MRGTKALCAVLATAVAVLAAPAVAGDKEIVITPVQPGGPRTILTLTTSRAGAAYVDVTLPKASVQPLTYASSGPGWTASGCGDSLYGFYLRPIDGPQETGVGALISRDLADGAGVANPLTPSSSGPSPAWPMPLGVAASSHSDDASYPIHVSEGRYRAYVIAHWAPSTQQSKTRKCVVRVALSGPTTSRRGAPLGGPAAHLAKMQWGVGAIGAGEPGVPQPRAGFATFDLTVAKTTLVFTIMQWVFFDAGVPVSEQVYAECVEPDPVPVCRPVLPAAAPGYTPAPQGTEFWRSMFSTESGTVPVGHRDIVQAGEWYKPGKLPTGNNTVKLVAASSGTPMLIQGAVFAIDL